MSNPSGEAVNSLIGLIRELGLNSGNRSGETILAGLMADVVANPDPQPQVARVLVESELLSLLTDPGNGSLGKLMQWPNLPLLREDIKKNNHDGVLVWSKVLSSINLITMEESLSINEYVNGMIPDPGWRSEIPRIEIMMGRVPDLDDIMAALADMGGS